MMAEEYQQVSNSSQDSAYQLKTNPNAFPTTTTKADPVAAMEYQPHNDSSRESRSLLPTKEDPKMMNIAATVPKRFVCSTTFLAILAVITISIGAVFLFIVVLLYSDLLGGRGGSGTSSGQPTGNPSEDPNLSCFEGDILCTTGDCKEVNFTFETDNNPGEANITLENVDTGAVAWSYSNFSADNSYEYQTFICSTSLYLFQIFDVAADGFLSDGFQLFYDEELVLEGNSFNDSIKVYLPPAPAMPTSNPTATTTPTTSSIPTISTSPSRIPTTVQCFEDDIICTSGVCSEVRLTLTTDLFPNETSFRLTNVQTGAIAWSYSEFTGNTQYEYNASVCSTSCYLFRILDSSDDGLWNDGFQLLYDGELVLEGDYFEDSLQIYLGEDCSSSTIAPTIGPTPSQATTQLPTTTAITGPTQTPTVASNRTQCFEDDIICGSGTCTELRLTLETDDYPFETSFRLTNLQTGANGWVENTFSANTEYEFNILVCSASCYFFRILDLSNDGLWSDGFKLFYDQELVLEGTYFGDSSQIYLGGLCFPFNPFPTAILPTTATTRNMHCFEDDVICTSGACTEVRLILQTDDYPNESSFTLTNIITNSVAWSYNIFSSNTNYEYDASVCSSSCYLFQISDISGDGLWSDGFQLFYGQALMLEGDFFGRSSEIYLGDGCPS